MKHLLISALAAGTIVTGSAVALAQISTGTQPAPRGHPFFENMDANQDGVVTRAEVTAATEKRFADLDTDRDGKVSQAERQAAREAMRARRTTERFAALDADKNGQLSPQEFDAARDKRGRPGMGAERKGHGRGGWGQGERGRGSQADVAKADFMAPALRRFDVMDSNDDGKITAEERDSAMARFHHRPGDRPKG